MSRYLELVSCIKFFKMGGEQPVVFPDAVVFHL